MNAILGVDVSRFQGVVDWVAAAAGGVRFALVKLLEGLTIDPTAKANLEGARAAGIVVGVYAFARVGGDAVAQAKALWAAVGDEMPSLPPALDLESAPKGMSSAAIVAWAEAWVRQVLADFGRLPFLYSYPSFLLALGVALERSELLRSCPLWIAGGGQYLHGDGHTPDLTREHAPVVALWGSDWTLWQFDGDGGRRLPGGGADVDWNILNGGEDALRRLQGLPEAPPTVPEVVHPDVPLEPREFDD